MQEMFLDHHSGLVVMELNEFQIRAEFQNINQLCRSCIVVRCRGSVLAGSLENICDYVNGLLSGLISI